MAAIVPENVLFAQNLKDFRQFLCDHVNIQCIVSLPAGCFLPYTNVKTNILYLTDIDCKPTEKYWYFKVGSDGYSLDNKRNKILGDNDLDKLGASAMGREIPEGGEDETYLLNIGAQVVDVQQLNTYKRLSPNLPDGNSEHPLLELQQCISEHGLQSGKRPAGGALTLEEAKPNPVVSLGGEHINLDGSISTIELKYVPYSFFTKMNKGITKRGDILMNKDGALTGKTAMVRKEFSKSDKVMVNEHVFIIRHEPSVIEQAYLFYVLRTINSQKQLAHLSQKTAQPGLNRQDLLGMKIPVPSLNVQKKIVAKLEEKRIRLARKMNKWNNENAVFIEEIDGIWPLTS